MCQFCDNLKYQIIKVPIRTSLADDNVCEFASPDESGTSYDCNDCDGCKEENNYFSITMWDNNLCLSYYHKIKNIIIAPESARFSINYCPMCSKKITDDITHELIFW
jgi:hypothetical protein